MERAKRTLAVIIALAMVISMFVTFNVTSVYGAGTTAIVNLEVDSGVNPLGIDNPTPYFSWQMESNMLGQNQRACQIKVAADPGFSNMVWDSGTMPNTTSSGVKYEGPALTSSTIYYWKVIVTDKDGVQIESPVANFETALMDTTVNNWAGSDWIGMGTASVGTPPAGFHYTVEADIKINHGAGGIVFNHIDSRNFLFWQINAGAETANKVLLRPHRWSNNGAASLVTAANAPNLTDNFGLNITVDSIKNNYLHMKIDVTATTITTYINGVQVDQRAFPSTAYVTPYIGSIGFRADASTVNGVNAAEDYLADNIKVINYTTNPTNGDVVYDYNFDNGINPFPSGTIENGAIHVGNRAGVFVANDRRATTFRREFTPDTASHGAITSARLYSTALGVYDMWINGDRVGNKQSDGSYVYDELKPGYTQNPVSWVTQVRRNYFTYDVTDLLNSGSNAISATVSSGWWSGGVAFNTATQLAFRAKLMIKYADGYTEWVNTNTTDWKVSSKVSPVMSAGTGIWDGEVYDSNADTSWRNPGYTDNSNWNSPVVITEFPSNGIIQAIPGAKVRVRKDLDRLIKSAVVYNGAIGANANQYGKINILGEYTNGQSFVLNPGETVVIDFGQNAAGWPLIQVEGPKNTNVKMRFGEMLNDNNGLRSRGNDGPEGSLYTANLRQSWVANGTYIMNGNGIETYHPTHTFYGFRYMSITATQTITVHDVKGQVVTSVMQDTGSLSTSNKDLNQLISNITWGEYSNYLSVPTDCPQRNERQGFSGDSQVFIGTGIYNADISSFFVKWLTDLRDGALASNGAFGDIAPSTWTDQSGHGVAGWADGGIIIPYTLYKMYGDTRFIDEGWTAMKKFMDVYMAGSNKEGGNRKHGDWVAYESNDDTIKRMISVAYYAWDAQMMAELAAAIGKTADVEKYRQVYDEEKAYFQQLFVNADGSLKRTEQTACLMALKVDLLPNDASKAKVKQALLDNIARNGDKLQTGFIGTAALMPTLSKIGATDVAYKLLLQRGNPSWLYSVDQGATTIWERWNSYTKEGGFGPVDMNSFNHYAYGCVGEWMYNYMAGISSDINAPGFKHIILQPNPDQTVKAVNCSYDSAYGTITSNWKYNGNLYTYDAEIPANTTATVYLPVEPGKNIKVNGEGNLESLTLESNGIEYTGIIDNKAVFNIVSGKAFNFATEVTEYVYITLGNASSDVVPMVKINDGPLQAMPNTIKAGNGDEVKIESFVLNDVDYSFDTWTGDVDGATIKGNTITFNARDGMTLTTNYQWNGWDSIAIGATVTGNSVTSNSDWGYNKLVDGVLISRPGSLGYTSGAFTTQTPTTAPNVVINMLAPKTFNRFHIYPRSDTLALDGTTASFPVNFVIETSNDNSSWTPVYTGTNVEAPFKKPFVVKLASPVTAQYIRVTISKIGKMLSDTSTDYRVQLAEFGVYSGVNKSLLEAAIADAEAYEGKEALYSAGSWESLQNAVKEAKRVYADEDATQKGVDTATDALNNAMANLVSLSAVIVDKDSHEPVEPQEVYMDAPFTVLVKTPADVMNLKFVNETGGSVSRTIVNKQQSGENEITWVIAMSVGTVGEGRTLRLHTQGTIGGYADTGKDLVFDVVKAAPAQTPTAQVISAEWVKKGAETSVLINEEFTVKVVTTADVTKVSLKNETGGSIGQISKTTAINGEGKKVWLITIKIGTSGNPRAITASGYSPTEGDLNGQSFQIVITK